jgi:hypothetical protein
MSHHPTPRESHLAHEDNRHEASRLRAVVREGERAGAACDEKWQRRIQPLLNTCARASDDFEGAVE